MYTFVCLSLAVPWCLSPSLSLHNTHTVKSVGPSLLHYVNHHFPSTAASFLCRLHFLYRMQIPAKLSPVYLPLCVFVCTWECVCLLSATTTDGASKYVAERVCVCAYMWAIRMQISGCRYIWPGTSVLGVCVCMSVWVLPTLLSWDTVVQLCNFLWHL